MDTLRIKLAETTLSMNHFPGWVDEPDWQKTFKRNAKDIAALWFYYSLSPKKMKLKSAGPYVEVNGDISSSIMIGRANLVEGTYDVSIDKEAMTASVKIGGIFEIDVSAMSKSELSGLVANKHFFINGFTFSNAKGGDTSAQGHFTDSWDNRVAIEVAFL